MNKDEALKLALEALEELNETNSYWWQEVDEATVKKIDPAIAAIKQALEQPAQEPSGRVVSASCNHAVIEWSKQTSIKGGGDPKNALSWPIGGEVVYLTQS